MNDKLTIKQAKIEDDHLLAFTDDNSLDVIVSVSKQIDSGKCFADIREKNPQSFKDITTAPTDKPNKS